MEHHTLLTIPNVRVVHITATSTEEEETLAELEYVEITEPLSSSKCLLRCGTTLIPLPSTSTPTLKVGPLRYVFPSPHSASSFVGLVLEEGTPPQIPVILDNLLAAHTAFVDQSPSSDTVHGGDDGEEGGVEDEEDAVVEDEEDGEERIETIETTGAAIRGSMVNATARTVAETLITSAEVIGRTIESTGAFLETRVPQSARPVRVSARAKAAVRQASQISSAGAAFSTSLSHNMRTAAVALGASAPLAAQSETFRTVRNASLGTLDAVDRVVDSVCSSASIVGSSLTSTTENVVEAAMGSEAGEFAGECLSVVGNVVAGVGSVGRISVLSLLSGVVRGASTPAPATPATPAPAASGL